MLLQHPVVVVTLAMRAMIAINACGGKLRCYKVLQWQRLNYLRHDNGKMLCIVFYIALDYPGKLSR